MDNQSPYLTFWPVMQSMWNCAVHMCRAKWVGFLFFFFVTCAYVVFPKRNVFIYPLCFTLCHTYLGVIRFLSCISQFEMAENNTAVFSNYSQIGFQQCVTLNLVLFFTPWSVKQSENMHMVLAGHILTIGLKSKLN